MKPFSISDFNLIITISKFGNSQLDVTNSLLSEISSIQTSLSKEIIVIDLSVKQNTGANYWDGILIYTTSDSGIVFH
jgi:hypothetical protein